MPARPKPNLGGCNRERYATMRGASGNPPQRGLAVALTDFHTRLLAEELTLRPGRGAARVLPTLSGARVDLHPHQVEAAAFALDSLGRGGCLLADEVGLGKTIEAGIVLSQLLAEGKERILILTPATLRAQWQAELREKFDVDSVVVDGRSRGTPHLFQRPFPIIASLPFAAARPEALLEVAWDVVVIDEAHRLRNAHRPGHKTGRALQKALAGRPKLLLTATPLQNELLELYGLLSFLDVGILGPEHAFRSRYAPAADGSLPGRPRRSSRRGSLAPCTARCEGKCGNTSASPTEEAWWRTSPPRPRSRPSTRG